MGFPTLLIMSAALAVGAFLAGSVPLWVAFSESHMQKLSAVGTGLLLGAALGVIIPEGVESLTSSSGENSEPAPQIALSLLLGFTFMFILEQFISPHSHESSHKKARNNAPRLSRQSTASSRVEFDEELDMDQFERDLASPEHKPLTHYHRDEGHSNGAFAITAGLVVHGLADGLALGVSTLTSPPKETTEAQSTGHQLSLVVFIALFIHKAPTALALTTTLLSQDLSRNLTRLHLATFSAATPVGAIGSYLLLNWMSSSSSNDWAGLALLFSGGTFLYVATVLQPISDTESTSDEGMGPTLSNRVRVICVIFGMFLPFGISSIIGHGH